MKRIVSAALALICIMLVPMTAWADGTLLHDYGEVTVTVPVPENYMKALEDEFRRYVWDRAKAYLMYGADDQAWYKYYFEAAYIKHEFDGEYLNKDLPYNTTVQLNDEQYDQQTREVFLRMISANVQRKEAEMKSLSDAQLRNFYPGIAFDPTMGCWVVEKEAMIVQETYNLELQQALEKEIVAMEFVLLDSLVDDILLISGANVSDTAMKVRDLIMKLVESAWMKWTSIEQEEAKKYLKNAYREAMVNAVVRAQKNVDDQMYSGLIQIRADMRAQGTRLSHDDQIMLEVLEGVLATITGTKEAEDMLKLTVSGGKTIDQVIEMAANELVNSMNMTEEVPIQWQEANGRVFLEILKTVLKEGIGCIFEAYEIEGSAIFVNATIDEMFAKLEGGSEFDADGSGAISKKEVLKYFGEKLVFDGGRWSKLLSPVVMGKSGSQQALDAAKKRLDVTKAMEEVSKEMDPYSTDTYALGMEVMRAEQEVEYRKKRVETEKNLLSSLIDNAVKTVESAYRLFTDDTSIKNMMENEAFYSYYASLMYRTMQMAQEAAEEIVGQAVLYSREENVDSADLDELREFVDQLYVIYNTDLLGHAYYCTLAEYYAYETDYDARFVQHMREGERFMEDAKASAVERAGVLGGIGYAITYSLGRFATDVSVVGQTLGVSDYLKRVEAESIYGGWLKSDNYPDTDYAKVYNYIGMYLETARIPEKYEQLFEK